MFHRGDRELASSASMQHGVFTFDDARAAGLSVAQCNRRSATVWLRMYEGVFMIPGVPQTRESRLLAACLAATAPAAVSHRAAAASYGLPGGRLDAVEITCRRWLRTQKPDLVVHESRRFDERDVTVVNAVPTVTPERCILDLAAFTPSPNYVEAVIQAARRRRLITYDSMLGAFNRHARRGLRGIRAVRIALDRWERATRPTQSEMETLLLQALRDHGLPEPVTQFDVIDETGRCIATADAALPRWRITIEYDSMQEHLDEFQVAKDARRRNQVMAAGYWPITARVGDLRNGGHTLVDEILQVARRAI
jgi:very-short-patch-repair endonuclease